VNLNTFEVTRFFNLARYQCYQPFYFFIGLQPSGRAKRAAELANVGDAGSMSLWLGLNCDSLLNQIDSTRCQQIAHEPLRGWPIIQPSPWETIAAPSRRRSCAARC